MGFEVNNPFLYQLREGSLADPFVDKVESLRVVDGRLLLSEMPVKQNGVIVDGHTEIDTNTPTGTQFYVDYTNGTVYFVSTKNATVTARYKGRGLVQIPSERIYHKKGSVTRTLDVIVETVDTSAIAASNAASLANAKATAADNAATAANTQSTYAKAQGDYAKAQGDYATTAVSNANTATNVANNATNAASTATTQANAARDAANTAAANANAKATLAEQKAAAVDVVATKADTNANFATAQGTYAKAQGDYAKSQGDAVKLQGDYAKQQGDAVATKLTDIQTVKDSALQAITNTVLAEQNANTATVNATTAYNQANAATASANTAANLANSKATLADEKANLANQKADLADQKAIYASAQGDYAKGEADKVVTKIGEANTSIANANKATTDATSATTGVLNSIAQVTNQGTLAGQAAASATSQADYAKIQGDYAKAQGDAAKAAVVGTITNKAVTSAKLDDDVQVGSLKTLKTDVKASVTGALNEIFEDVTKSVLGGKMTSTTLANFVGKVSGSTTANPHVAKRTSGGQSGATSLQNPNSGQFGVEPNYNEISTLDSTTWFLSVQGNAQIAQEIFSFNLIEQIQRQYGITLSGTTADKVAWLKANLSKLTFNWHGYGSSATGNKANITMWRASTSIWETSGYMHTGASVAKLTYNLSAPSLDIRIDSNGFAHYLAYAEASDGVTPSIINTDYAELLVELKTDILSNLPLATTTTPGAMSPADKAALDGGQKWKMTEADGSVTVLASGTDANTLTKTGRTYINAAKNNPLGDIGGFYFETDGYPGFNFATQRALRSSSTVSEVAEYFRSLNNGTWQPWKRVIDSMIYGGVLLGNKFVDQSNANFVGKVSGSTTANPHSSAVSYATALQSPDLITLETGNYTQITALDGSIYSPSTTTANGVAKNRFSFNLIEHVQRTYGTIPGATTADKVAWLKNNLSKLTFNWFGFGSSPAGNKATIAWWNGVGLTWGALGTNTSTAPSKLSITHTGGSGLNQPLDSSGFVHFLAYADASDGTTASVINTDYVELNVELSTDLWSSAKPQWVNATLQNSWVEFDATQTPKFTLGKDGFVELKGGLKSGVLGSSGFMFTLPTGYRPLASVNQLVAGLAGNIYNIVIDTAGKTYVTQTVGSNGNTFVSIDGVRFPTL